MEEIAFHSEPENTDDIQDCDNIGCVFNNDGECTSTGAGCFVYIEPKPTQ